MKPTIVILDGRRIVFYPEAAIPDVLDDGREPPSPANWWEMFER